MKKKGKSKVKNKELETSITDKFMEAVHGLGHDAEKLKKEIAKAGKTVSQKISSALKDAQKAVTKAVDKKDKPKSVKKGDKKKDSAKKDVKTEKVVSEVSKAASNKGAAVSSRSVIKPVVPPIDKLPATAEKEEVKEAPAAAPVKRTRAPRRKKEEIEAQKASVNEASAPVKRKRAPRSKPKPEAAPQTNSENPAIDSIGSAVL